MKCNICLCGEKPNVLQRKSVLGERMYAVKCPSCHRATDSCFERKEAIELWNGSYGKEISV